MKGMGSEWSCKPANSTSPPGFKPFPPEKLIILYKFWVRGLSTPTCKGEDGEVYTSMYARAAGQGREPRKGD